jgi:acetyltransferase-like isoleucine patch superfamily enzyme
LNGKYRDKCLNENCLISPDDVRSNVEAYCVDYNEVRPHSSRDDKTPTEFTRSPTGLADSAAQRRGQVTTPRSSRADRKPRERKSGRAGNRCGATTVAVTYFADPLVLWLHTQRVRRKNKGLQRPRDSAQGIVGLVVAALSTAVALAWRVAQTLVAPVARFWHLASLKSRTDGSVPVTTQFDGAVESAGRLRLEIGDRCRFGRRVFLETCDGGVIRMGANVRINSGTFIVAYAEVSIGRDSGIGEYVSIRDADHGLAADRPFREQPHSVSPIRIGEGVWIGRGAVILKGVTIGDGAVIAANSVVARDVRPMTIVAGAPAREIRERRPSPISAVEVKSDGAKAAHR